MTEEPKTEEAPASDGGSIRVDQVAEERPDAVEPPASAFTPPAAEPTPTVTADQASWSHPAGTAAPAEASDRPEAKLVGAFAGGLLFATILKRLAR